MVNMSKSWHLRVRFSKQWGLVCWDVVNYECFYQCEFGGAFRSYKAYSFMIVLHRRCANAYLSVFVSMKCISVIMTFWLQMVQERGICKQCTWGLTHSKYGFLIFLQSTFDTFHYDYLEDIDHSMKNVCIPPPWSYMHIITRLKGDQVAAKWNIHICISL